MSLMDMLNNAKTGLSDLKRKYKFMKANKSREAAAELQASLAKCRGQLEICAKEFNRVIVNQSKNIAAGKKQNADTILQEQMLWDAAIGYMLVKDAIYAVQTINSHDSVAHAYDMLDAAVEQMKGKKNKLLDIPHLKAPKRRNAYGYVNSDAAVKEKEIMLDGFFEKLKVTGDIEACLKEIYAASNAATAMSVDGVDYAELLNRMPDGDDGLSDEDLRSIKDIKTPGK